MAGMFVKYMIRSEVECVGVLLFLIWFSDG